MPTPTKEIELRDKWYRFMLETTPVPTADESCIWWLNELNLAVKEAEERAEKYPIQVKEENGDIKPLKQIITEAVEAERAEIVEALPEYFAEVGWAHPEYEKSHDLAQEKNRVVTDIISLINQRGK